jgi:small subunit ribosomal protein S9
MDGQTQTIKRTSKNTKKDYVFAVGRRKEAVARVRLYMKAKEDLQWNGVTPKKGDILVNGKAISEYFPALASRHMYAEPLRVTNAHQQNYIMTIKVEGGGPAGQLQAVVSGIANVLQKADPEKYRPILKKKGFLTRDARIRQRRNVGTGGKARHKKQSPKR